MKNCFISLRFFSEEEKLIFTETITSVRSLGFTPIELMTNESLQTLPFGEDKIEAISSEVLKLIDNAKVFINDRDVEYRDLGGMIEQDLAIQRECTVINLIRIPKGSEIILSSFQVGGHMYYLVIDWFYYPVLFTSEDYTKFHALNEWGEERVALFKTKYLDYQSFHNTVHASLPVKASDIYPQSVPMKGFLTAYQKYMKEGQFLYSDRVENIDSPEPTK